jgi:hypothetical protein
VNRHASHYRSLKHVPSATSHFLDLLDFSRSLANEPDTLTFITDWAVHQIYGRMVKDRTQLIDQLKQLGEVQQVRPEYITVHFDGLKAPIRLEGKLFEADFHFDAKRLSEEIDTHAFIQDQIDEPNPVKAQEAAQLWSVAIARKASLYRQQYEKRQLRAQRTKSVKSAAQVETTPPIAVASSAVVEAIMPIADALPLLSISLVDPMVLSLIAPIKPLMHMVAIAPNALTPDLPPSNNLSFTHQRHNDDANRNPNRNPNLLDAAFRAIQQSTRRTGHCWNREIQRATRYVEQRAIGAYRDAQRMGAMLWGIRRISERLRKLNHTVETLIREPSQQASNVAEQSTVFNRLMAAARATDERFERTSGAVLTAIASLATSDLTQVGQLNIQTDLLSLAHYLGCVPQGDRNLELDDDLKDWVWCISPASVEHFLVSADSLKQRPQQFLWASGFDEAVPRWECGAIALIKRVKQCSYDEAVTVLKVFAEYLLLQPSVAVPAIQNNVMPNTQSTHSPDSEPGM